LARPIGEIKRTVPIKGAKAVNQVAKKDPLAAYRGGYGRVGKVKKWKLRSKRTEKEKVTSEQCKSTKATPGQEKLKEKM